MEIALTQYEESLVAQAPQSLQTTPHTPGPSLDSGWNTVRGRHSFAERILWLRARCLSAAPDDTLFFGTEGFGVWVHNAAQQQPDYEQVAKLGGVVHSLAAISKRIAWAVYQEGAAVSIRKFEMGGASETAPVLPDARQPLAVAAAFDGTVWALSKDGFVFALSADRREWKPVDKGEYQIERIAVGSAKNIRALAKKGVNSYCLTYMPDQSWKADSKWNLGAVPWLAACADGSAWARRDNRFFVARDAETGWREVPGMAGRPETQMELNAAGSGLCCFTRHPKDGMTQFGCYKRGILSLEPRSWPAQTTTEAAAYRAIGAKLGIRAEGGLRAQYGNVLAPFENYHATLNGLDCPEGIDQAAWNMVKPQILNELTYVSTAHKLFANMSTVTNSIGILNTGIPPAAALLVGLKIDEPKDRELPVGTYVYSMWRTALDVMLGLVPFPYNMVTSLLNTAAFLAIDELTGVPERPTDPNYAFPIRFGELTETMRKLYLAAVDKNAFILRSIVQDWGRLDVAGDAIASGIWQWNPEYNGRMVDATSRSFEIYFYRSLMMAKWQILVMEYIVPANAGKPDWVRSIPEHVIMQDGDPVPWHREGHDYLIWKFRICNLRGNKELPPNDAGPFPTKPLFDKLNRELNQSTVDILFGKNGWNLTVRRWDQEQQLATSGYLLGTF